MVSKTRLRLRHFLIRYRRPLAALCAFGCVLMTIAALRPPPPLATPSDAANGHHVADDGGWSQPITDGLVAAPVRLADADVAKLLHAGSVVDVLAADGKGHAVVVAEAVDVIEVPEPSDEGFASASFDGALIVLAVSSSEATELAASSAVGPLSVVVRS